MYGNQPKVDKTLAKCMPDMPKVNNALANINKKQAKCQAAKPKVNKTLAKCGPTMSKVINALAKIK